MENKKTEPCGTAENKRSGEAELLAEILTRMDEKQKRDTENAAPKARAASGKNTIDLVELFFFLLSKLHYILLGMVLGIGAKLFTIAGPVLVWGVSASVLVGIVYALFPW